MRRGSRAHLNQELLVLFVRLKMDRSDHQVMAPFDHFHLSPSGSIGPSGSDQLDHPAQAHCAHLALALFVLLVLAQLDLQARLPTRQAPGVSIPQVQAQHATPAAAILHLAYTLCSTC